MGEKFATDRLLLVTANELGWFLAVTIGVITLLGVVGIVRFEVRKVRVGQNRARGTAPGQGSTLIHAASLNPSSGNSFGESSRTWAVTKDPQTYAKGMMPRTTQIGASR